jgi:hypothetical protein
VPATCSTRDFWGQRASGRISAVIDKRALLVVISSINPCIIRQRPIIATTLTEEEKQSIVRTLETQSTIRGVATKLAVQAGQNQVAAVVPKVYE